MSITQGDVWWADLSEPVGSAAGFRRPVVIVQGDAFNRSAIATVVCVPVTSNLTWARAPGNVELRPRDSGLPKPSVANVSQLTAIDRAVLIERAGRLPSAKLASFYAASIRSSAGRVERVDGKSRRVVVIDVRDRSCGPTIDVPTGRQSDRVVTETLINR